MFMRKPDIAATSPFAEIGLYPVSQEYLTPEEYLSVSKVRAAIISSVRFVPPRLGDSHFGRIYVQYRHPVYRTGKDTP